MTIHGYISYNRFSFCLVCFYSLRLRHFVPRAVVWLARFDDVIGQLRQFAHDCDDDDHFGLACIRQITNELRECTRPIGNQCGHIQGAFNPAMSVAAQSAFLVYARPRLFGLRT